MHRSASLCSAWPRNCGDRVLLRMRWWRFFQGELAIELSRYCSDVAEKATRSGLASWRLRRIDERLKDGRSMPSVAELAELCVMSPRHLTRSFRISRGCTISDYINTVRFEQAKRLLNSELSIKQIAHEIGFSSASGFCWAFRRETGSSPTQYRHSLAGSARKSRAN
jgi:AraC family transcriptional regulator